MPVIMQCAGIADGRPSSATGLYLKSFDPSYNNGIGHAHWTDDIKEAMRFADMGELFEFWKQTSTVRPKRDDGKPNRPLTAYNIIPITIPAAESGEEQRKED